MDIKKLTTLTEALAEVKTQIADLELTARGLSSEIMEILQGEGFKSFDTNGIRVTVCHRRKYRYPHEITTLENQLRDAKKHFEIDSQNYETISYISTKFL